MMPLALFAHPFSSYCQKAMIALYENETPFTLRLLDHNDPATLAEFAALWPVKRFPLLLDGERPIAEATIIVEHLSLHYPGPVKLLPDDPDTLLEVRFVDRFFDNYVQTPQGKIVADARAMLDTAYAWLEKRMARREWAVADRFSLADCSAAPALFYADWTHPISDAFPNLRAYRSRLNARPSFARAIDGARPYRSLFPLGAPDRD